MTKSRFKLALSCPTKLYYENNSEYENLQKENSFLEALAEGGYQVGELAKCYFPGGHDIVERGYKIPLSKTEQLLKQENVIIYEASIRYENYFIRVDILEKTGNQIKLIEVKAKSYDGGGVSEFLSAKGKPSGEWSEYLHDVAFQKYVTQKAFPHLDITAFLMLADKTKTTTVNGLNQKFQMVTGGSGQKYVEKVGDVSREALGAQILTAVNVDSIAEDIIEDKFKKEGKPPFKKIVEDWARAYVEDEKIISPIGIHCFSCQFRSKSAESKSGFNECWKQQKGFTDAQLRKPMIDAIWNYRGKKKLLDEGIYFIEELTKKRFNPQLQSPTGKLSSRQRQWLQIEKTKNQDDSVYLHRKGLKKLLNGFNYPLHFIDFETSSSAVPFYLGHKPYETVAFQFSHHTIAENGEVEHKDEFIKMERGAFPNFTFARRLKKVLENDTGTIFRYAAHENTVLNQIALQLDKAELNEIPDKIELIEFIHSITHSKSENRTGTRNMVDLCKIVKDHFFDPRTNGSNSIKAVLPAILSRSSYLQEKYSSPIYGKSAEIKSLNFENGWRWIRYDEEGNVLDPYELLPGIFDDLNKDEITDYTTANKLSSGGAAMAAFGKIQFTQISEAERIKVIDGLLKYCELDTLAMVMIYEYFMHEVNL